MENQENIFHLYHDIQRRTGGEIYVGVVGPVRTGKSTLIKRIMEELVIPGIMDENARKRAIDEMPQSGAGKMITTTEPKFVPREAANIKLTDDISLKIRLIDCVGYLVKGAEGHKEGEENRMVSTPWFEEQIPFEKAAQIGTDRVINEHATIGLVVTTDGSFGEIDREAYVSAEEKTVETLKKIGKPFVILVNSLRPYSMETLSLVEELQKKYGVGVLALNCLQLRKEDIHHILKQILFAFPMNAIEFYMPAWVEMLPKQHPLKQDIIGQLRNIAEKYTNMKEVIDHPLHMEGEYLRSLLVEDLDMATGILKVQLHPKQSVYYEELSKLMGEKLHNEYEFMKAIGGYGRKKLEYDKVFEAVEKVRNEGYSVMTPQKEEIEIRDPELIRHGNKYGVKIKASSPSIHMIRANIETEIAPIVGEQNQAQDLIDYIIKSKEEKEGIWETTIFGKSVEQLVEDGIKSRTEEIGEECQKQLQDTMQKIVNDKNGGMICIII